MKTLKYKEKLGLHPLSCSSIYSFPWNDKLNIMLLHYLKHESNDEKIDGKNFIYNFPIISASSSIYIPNFSASSIDLKRMRENFRQIETKNCLSRIL